jgi:hypothetical protein
MALRKVRALIDAIDGRAHAGLYERWFSEDEHSYLDLSFAAATICATTEQASRVLQQLENDIKAVDQARALIGPQRVDAHLRTHAWSRSPLHAPRARRRWP